MTHLLSGSLIFIQFESHNVFVIVKKSNGVDGVDEDILLNFDFESLIIIARKFISLHQNIPQNIAYDTYNTHECHKRF